MITPQAYLTEAKNAFLAISDTTYAEKQEAYMRNKFAYYGVRSPQQKEIFNRLFKTYGKYSQAALRQFVEISYDDEYREIHYLATMMVEKQVKKEDETFIHFLEYMIVTNSWWDTVDWISKMVSYHFQRFPHQIQLVTRLWMDSDNIWLQRVAIIFQRYKHYQTDEKLLFQYILELADSKEFFIQKASGWALRDHSKIHPQEVAKFLNENPQLSALTKREARKYL